MDTRFSTPKSFGKILDHTFSLSKDKFLEFFTVFLIFLGPIYLLQAAIQLFSGTPFLRAAGEGEIWLEQALMSFGESDAIFADIGVTFVSFISIFLLPVAMAAIINIVDHIRKNEEYTLKGIIKKSFSRSGFLFSMIVFGIITFPTFFIVIFSVIAGILHVGLGIFFAIILSLIAIIGIGLLLTKWAFYLGFVALGEDSLGFGKSWMITKNRTWATFGIFTVFYIIITIINTTIQLSLAFVLGNSILYTLIIGIVSLFTYMILAIGYAVVFFDLKLRHEAEDLKELIGEYHSNM